MIDKGLDKLLTAFFGTGGITILILAWVQPMPLPERMIAIVIGAIGLVWVLIRALSWRSGLAKVSVAESQAEVEV